MTLLTIPKAKRLIISTDLGNVIVSTYFNGLKSDGETSVYVTVATRRSDLHREEVLAYHEGVDKQGALVAHCNIIDKMLEALEDDI